MSIDVALPIAFLIIFTAVVFVAVRQARIRAQAQEEELHKAASLRGWGFAATHAGSRHVYTFSGTTDGVAWEAESLTLAGGRHREARHIARWNGRWSPGVTAPLLAVGVPKGKEAITLTMAQGDGVVARLAQKAAGLAFDKAIDAYFGEQIGKEVDAAALRPIAEPSVPGFILMAGNVDEARRILSDGLQRALLEATNNTANALSDADRPWILLRPQGLSLARAGQFRDADDLDRVIRAGVGLSRAFRFGRPTS